MSAAPEGTLGVEVSFIVFYLAKYYFFSVLGEI